MLSFLPLIASVSALGINCRGSSQCAVTQFNGMQQMRDYVCDPSHGLLDQQFGQGEHIAYASKQIDASVTIGPVGGSASGTYNYALFYQNIGDSKHSGQDACDLLNTLVKHGCLGCGSAPISMVNGGPNSNIKNGQLTLNYVR